MRLDGHNLSNNINLCFDKTAQIIFPSLFCHPAYTHFICHPCFSLPSGWAKSLHRRATRVWTQRFQIQRDAGTQGKPRFWGKWKVMKHSYRSDTRNFSWHIRQTVVCCFTITWFLSCVNSLPRPGADNRWDKATMGPHTQAHLCRLVLRQAKHCDWVDGSHCTI